MQFEHVCVGVYVFVNTNRQHNYAVVVACHVKLTEKERCVELHMHSESHCINHGASMCFLLCYHSLHLLSNKAATVHNAIVESMLVIVPHMHRSLYRCCVNVLINKLLAMCFVWSHMNFAWSKPLKHVKAIHAWTNTICLSSVRWFLVQNGNDATSLCGSLIKCCCMWAGHIACAFVWENLHSWQFNSNTNYNAVELCRCQMAKVGSALTGNAIEAKWISAVARCCISIVCFCTTIKPAAYNLQLLSNRCKSVWSVSLFVHMLHDWVHEFVWGTSTQIQWFEADGLAWWCSNQLHMFSRCCICVVWWQWMHARLWNPSVCPNCIWFPIVN